MVVQLVSKLIIHVNVQPSQWELSVLIEDNLIIYAVPGPIDCRVIFYGIVQRNLICNLLGLLARRTDIFNPYGYVSIKWKNE